MYSYYAHIYSVSILTIAAVKKSSYPRMSRGDLAGSMPGKPAGSVSPNRV